MDRNELIDTFALASAPAIVAARIEEDLRYRDKEYPDREMADEWHQTDDHLGTCRGCAHNCNAMEWPSAAVETTWRLAVQFVECRDAVVAEVMQSPKAPPECPTP